MNRNLKEPSGKAFRFGAVPCGVVIGFPLVQHIKTKAMLIIMYSQLCQRRGKYSMFTDR